MIEGFPGFCLKVLLLLFLLSLQSDTFQKEYDSYKLVGTQTLILRNPRIEIFRSSVFRELETSD